MKKLTTMTAVLVALGTSALPASALEQPDLAGSWVAVDCVVWWEHGSQPLCDQPGDDASTIHLQIGGPADAPRVVLMDDHATGCVEAGSGTATLLARGTAIYEEHGVTLVFDRLGCGAMQPLGSPWVLDIHWDDGGTDDRNDDTLWWDPDGDGYGHNWHRP